MMFKRIILLALISLFIEASFAQMVPMKVAPKADQQAVVPPVTGGMKPTVPVAVRPVAVASAPAVAAGVLNSKSTDSTPAHKVSASGANSMDAEDFIRKLERRAGIGAPSASKPVEKKAPIKAPEKAPALPASAPSKHVVKKGADSPATTTSAALSAPQVTEPGGSQKIASVAAALSEPTVPKWEVLCPKHVNSLSFIRDMCVAFECKKRDELHNHPSCIAMREIEMSNQKVGRN
jgi:LysM repeat protein